MAVDCFALSVQVNGGSSVCVVECGGIQVTSGDILLLKMPLARQIYQQYKPHFCEPVKCQLQDQPRLRHGHYEHRRLKMVLSPMENVSIKEEIIDASKERIEDIAKNRSMNSEPAKKKRRTKAPVKATRKKEVTNA